MPLPTPSARRRLRLAVNYSSAAARLVRAGLVEVDLFKCPDHAAVQEAARRQRPVYVQFPLTAGRGAQSNTALDALAERLRLTSTPFVNTRLAPQIEPQAGMMSRLFKAIEQTLHDVRTLVDYFGADRVIVENTLSAEPHTPQGLMAAEPSFIRQIVEETGCGFLLNLAQARLAARSMQMDVRMYLSLLPVEAMRVLHVAGTPTKTDPAPGLMPLTDPDWKLLNWVIDQMHHGAWPTPRVVALEYGGAGPWFEARTDPAVLARQIGCMQQTIEPLAARAAHPARRNGLAGVSS